MAVIAYVVAVINIYATVICFWPSLIWPSWFVAVMVLAVMDRHVAVIVCGRHRRSPSSSSLSSPSIADYFTFDHQ